MESFILFQKMRLLHNFSITDFISRYCSTNSQLYYEVSVLLWDYTEITACYRGDCPTRDIILLLWEENIPDKDSARRVIEEFLQVVEGTL